jgi:hypothetical protein
MSNTYGVESDRFLHYAFEAFSSTYATVERMHRMGEINETQKDIFNEILRGCSTLEAVLETVLFEIDDIRRQLNAPRTRPVHRRPLPHRR